MSLLNSLYSGVSGLTNHQAMLDVIGNNIANVNSIGYKGSRITFSDTFNQFVRYGSDASATEGGTNTFQIGLGMKVSSIDRDWSQGTFESSSSSTDLALEGDGLFILESNGQKFYSRAGAFSFDSNGRLVNSDGAVVQGKNATTDGVVPPGNNLENVTIDPNLKLPAIATTNASWGGNLSSSSTITRSEKYVQTGNINSAMNIGDSIDEYNTIYDDNGNEYTFTTTYSKSAADTYNMTWDLTDSDGNSVATSAAATVMVFDSTGALTTMDGATPAVISVSNTDKGINFDFDPTGIEQTDGAKTISSVVDGNRDVNVVTGTLTIFDSLGNSHTLTLKFTKTADNEWNWSASVPAESGSLTLSSSSGTISFNTDGSIKSMSPNPPELAFNPSSGASEQSITLDFGEGFNGITQTSSESVVSALSQNGSAAATLTDVSIDQYGYIVGVFSNGYSRNLAQIMLASFPNLNGLTSVGDNLYTVSANSGNPLIGQAGEETGTTLQSGALEQSNVDLSEEFTKMIVAQRGFQANARTVTVSDTLLQEITNLVR